MSLVFVQHIAVPQYGTRNLETPIERAPNINPFSMYLVLLPVLIRFDDIGRFAILAIRHTRGRQLLRLSPANPTVVRRPRRSSPSPAPPLSHCLWAKLGGGLAICGCCDGDREFANS